MLVLFHRSSLARRTFSLAAALVAAIPFLAGLTGCMDITGRGPAPLARTIGPEEDARPLEGHVYCMRGWLGIFSTGMDALANKVDQIVPAVSVADEESYRLTSFLEQEHDAGRLKDPLVLVGHSWGADDQIRVAEDLGKHGITVDLLITIDPVTPPPIPPNVKRCVNIYKSHPATDWFPFWRGVAVSQDDTKVPVTNIDLRSAQLGFDTESIDHINVEKSPGVHQMVLNEIRKVCPPRVAAGIRAGVPVVTRTPGTPTPPAAVRTP